MSDGFFFKVFSFKCWRSKFTAFFFQKFQKKTILIFCYLIANNQLRCGIRETPYSVRMRENTKEKNSEYGYFSRSVLFL